MNNRSGAFLVIALTLTLTTELTIADSSARDMIFDALRNAGETVP